jgi:hypothetical protein
MGPNSGCPAGTQFTIDSLNNNVLENHAFYFLVN